MEKQRLIPRFYILPTGEAEVTEISNLQADRYVTNNQLHRHFSVKDSTDVIFISAGNLIIPNFYAAGVSKKPINNECVLMTYSDYNFDDIREKGREIHSPKNNE